MRIHSLDGLRAISILLVMLGHMASCGLAPEFFVRYGNFGVQVFFVISGYLITTLLLREKARAGTVDLKAFYFRRVLRIFPAAYIFVGAMLLVFRVPLHHAVCALTYTANYDPSAPHYIAHLWSLSVEEQFYLLWPTALVLFFRKSTRLLFAVILLTPVANIVLHFVAHTLIGIAFPSVADSLALGCLASFVAPKLNLGRRRFAWAGPIALGLQSLAGSVPAGILVLVLWPMIHILIAVFVIHAVEHQYKFLNLKPLMWLGLLSYSLYLWQQPFLNPAHAATWASPIAALACACLSYYLIEKPFLGLRERLRTNRTDLSTLSRSVGAN